MIFSSYGLYAALCLVSVTLSVSKKYPTLKDPLGYDLNSCSGVFVSPDEVLTAGHCLANSRGRQWVKVDGKSYAADMEKTDFIKDLALLRIKGMKHAYVELGRQVKISDHVYTVNAGYLMEGSFNEGIVNNFFDYEETHTYMILHSATIFSGASGSGLFNSKGQLVGINTDSVKSLSGAVDISVIKQFLKMAE